MNNHSLTKLHDLLDYDILQSHAAENQLKSSLKKWISQPSSLAFKSRLQEYLSITESHLLYLKDYTLASELPALPNSNRVMKAILAETEEKLKKCADKELQDACLLAAIQEINHLKISQYGTAASFAKALGNEKAASLYHMFEINEKRMDKKLTKIARLEINPKALAPSF
jgi:ferritin-like metal-binding protein YciE